MFRFYWDICVLWHGQDRQRRRTSGSCWCSDWMRDSPRPLRTADTPPATRAVPTRSSCCPASSLSGGPGIYGGARVSLSSAVRAPLRVDRVHRPEVSEARGGEAPSEAPRVWETLKKEKSSCAQTDKTLPTFFFFLRRAPCAKKCALSATRATREKEIQQREDSRTFLRQREGPGFTKEKPTIQGDA